MIWLVFGETVIGEVDARDKQQAEALARMRYGERVGRVQSQVSASVAATEDGGRRPAKRIVARRPSGKA